MKFSIPLYTGLRSCFANICIGPPRVKVSIMSLKNFIFSISKFSCIPYVKKCLLFSYQEDS